MAKLYVQAVPPPDLNRNTEWFMYPGVWTTYILILFFCWILVISVFGCAPGTAWTLVNLGHFAVRTATFSCCSPCYRPPVCHGDCGYSLAWAAPVDLRSAACYSN
jgi:hypothetical protein